jgi:FKBP-type peptidyl-prolyl cis-trans isomerase (trigger factor)
MTTKNIKTTVEKLANSSVKITAVIPASIIETFRKSAMERFQNTLKIDGFRAGHIPESTIIEKVGDMGLWMEMSEQAFTEHYPTIIGDSKQFPIAQPNVALSKIAPNEDVEYIVTTDVMPLVELKDVKKIAEEKNKSAIEGTVTDEEVENAIREIRQMRAHQKMHDDGHDHDDHNHQNIADADLPELNDEFVKSLGAFESVEDFKTKLKENMSKEKEVSAHEKRRIEIIEAIIEKAGIEVPNSMVDFELNKMLEQFKYDLSMSGMNIDGYLQHAAITLDELKSQWKEQAVKRVQVQLSLDSIANEFDIKPDADKVAAQVAQILEMYKDQQVEEANVIAYVTQIVTNTAVFDWLEAQK